MRGICFKCGTGLLPTEGIFCANFWCRQGHFAPCHRAWCGKCFTPIGTTKFMIRQEMDTDGVPLDTKDEGTRFLVARKGDHLMTPFQCPLCHIRNMILHDPDPNNPKHNRTIEYIYRAILDLLWGREESTVRKNLSKAIRMEEAMDEFGLDSCTPEMGPFPLKDIWGMKPALAVLRRSEDPGLYEETVQFETFRKTRSAFTNIIQAGVESLRDVIGAYERSQVWVSSVPTHSHWFSQRFMVGLSRRHGSVVKQDWPIPIEVVHEIDATLDQEWRSAPSVGIKKRISEMSV